MNILLSFSGEKPWCLMSYIKNPAHPTQNCFLDVRWSATYGSFYSNEACVKIQKVHGIKSTIANHWQFCLISAILVKLAVIMFGQKGLIKIESHSLYPMICA
jgi:hypothetical protein